MRFTVEVDHDHGGRWRSLRDAAGQEWCWRRPDPRRDLARSGDRLVDVGGVEECFPTIAGIPDHGEVWTEVFRPCSDGSYAVHTPSGQIHRRIEVGADIVVSYRLEAEPGFRFVWAFHLLLEPTADLTLDLPAGSPIRSWPGGYSAPYAETPWLTVPGVSQFDDLSSDDGTATFALAVDQASVSASARGRTLRLDLSAPGQPVGVGLWRNLGGFSWDGTEPYRSVGVEPMIGHHPDRQLADPAGLGRVDAHGRAAWSLRITQQDDSPCHS